MIKILDCTTRDGGFNTNWNFEDDFIKNLSESLKKNNVTYWEIGYRNHIENEGKGSFYQCTPEFLKGLYEQKGNLLLGVMTDTKRFNLSDFNGQNKDFIDFVRIATHPEDIPLTIEIAQDLHKLGYRIFIHLMDVSNIDEEGYLTLFNWQNKEILESLYFADSYGTLYPDDIEKYFYKLKSLGYEKISFHAHNTIGLALENTKRAINLGAFSVDCTKSGLGRSGGNLNATDLINYLSLK
jgi:4-hydroxy 2-oxovalerate aldolase